MSRDSDSKKEKVRKRKKLRGNKKRRKILGYTQPACLASFRPTATLSHITQHIYTYTCI